MRYDFACTNKGNIFYSVLAKETHHLYVK